MGRPAQLLDAPAVRLPAAVRRPAAVPPPGEHWQFSNAATCSSGSSSGTYRTRVYVDLVQGRVFDRVAGIDEHGFRGSTSRIPDVPVAYLDPRSRSTTTDDIYSVPVLGGADGGALGTPRDLGRFLDRVGDGALMGLLTDVICDPREDIGGGTPPRVRLFTTRGRVRSRWRQPRGSSCWPPVPADDANLVVLCNVEGGSRTCTERCCGRGARRDGDGQRPLTRQGRSSAERSTLAAGHDVTAPVAALVRGLPAHGRAAVVARGQATLGRDGARGAGGRSGDGGWWSPDHRTIRNRRPGGTRPARRQPAPARG